jgi:hypothetical protein
MRNDTRRRFRSPVAWALGLVLGIPALAEAQQSGLFPLRPIKRERVPCPMEDPVYRLNREQYFGYFPTCWRPFPKGWGCPSPEAPDVEKAFRDEPLQKPTGLAPLPGEEGTLPGMGPGEPGRGVEGMPGAPAPGPGNLPALPPGRSPFEIDEGKPAAPPAGGQPGTAPPRDRPSPSPFDPGALEPTRPSPGASSLPGPVESPTASTAPAAGGDASPTAQPPGSSEPLLALPDPSAPPSAAPAGGNPTNTATTPPGSVTPASGITGSILAPIYQAQPAQPAQPAQAPTRRGPISSFFNGLLRR